MKVLCLTKYTSVGPSSRYRVYQFIPHLRAAGIDVEVQCLHDESYLRTRFNGGRPSAFYLGNRFFKRVSALRKAGRFDVVFIQKEIFPHLPDVAEAVLHARGVNLVLDIDDAIFLLYEESPSPLKRWFLRNKLPRVIERSRLVLAGNEYIAEYARRFSNNVVVFPTVVDSERFSPGDRRPEAEVVTVGWIGSPETIGFLRGIVPFLEEVAANTPFELSIVGAGRIDVRGAAVSAKAWREDEEVDDLRRFDVGIMPLGPSRWSRGKCGLKLLQYMSVGLPSVSSPMGTAGEIITDGQNGFLAKDGPEWVEKLGRLLGSAESRRAVGDRARRWVLNNYNVSRFAPRLVEHLRRAAGA